MNSPQSKRILIRGLSGSVTASLLAGILVTGQAAAQATGSAPVINSNTMQDAGTKRTPVAHDPFSPFLYDVLGATPSIRLPAFLGKQALLQSAVSNDVSASDSTGKDVGAKSVATAAGRTDTGARLPQ